jgi:hypothetical protein
MTRHELERKAADLQAEIKSRRECGHNTYIIENCLEHIIDELIDMYPKLSQKSPAKE